MPTITGSVAKGDTLDFTPARLPKTRNARGECPFSSGSTLSFSRASMSLRDTARSHAVALRRRRSCASSKRNFGSARTQVKPGRNQDPLVTERASGVGETVHLLRPRAPFSGATTR
jgi:hypothetical protein